MSRSLKCSLGLFLTIKALVLIILIPPWQVPDEPTHAEYVMHLHELSPTLHTSIVESMTTFDTWRYTEDALARGDFTSIIAKKPMFYHWTVAQWVPFSSVLGKLYMLRFKSVLLQGVLFLACIWLARNVIIPYPPLQLSACEPHPCANRRGEMVVMVATVLFLIPQNGFSFSGVQPDVMVATIGTLVLAVVTSFWGNADGRKRPASGVWLGFRILLLCGLLVAAAATKDNALVVIPVTLFAATLLLFRSRRHRRLRYYTVSVAAVVVLLFFAIPFAGLYYDFLGVAERIHWSAGRLIESVKSIANLPLLITLRFGAILFVSFWYSYGWMVYKMSPTWYLVFAVITVISAAGWLIGHWRRRLHGSGVALCLFGLLFAVLIVFVTRGPQLNPELMDTQARYLLPMIAAAMVLMVLGWSEFFSSRAVSKVLNVTSFRKTTRSPAVLMLVVFLVFVNLVVVLKYLIPTFYLR